MPNRAFPLRTKRRLRSLLTAGVALCASFPALGDEAFDDLAQLSIEELGNIEITSVSKRAEPLSAAAASIYVITNDDIRRFGATSLPEALRLAPNLQVTQLDALSYAISARGFNSTEAGNKLLVLIDGRSVYSPLHSGVLWDAQDVMLEDVERIEVVGGPGGTLWGANAVNGIINVITKSAADTQGSLVTGSYGNIDQTFSARYGGAVGETVNYRAYVKGFKRDHSNNPNGTKHIDDWEHVQGGFKSAWTGENDKATVHGDFYDGGLDTTPSTASGQNVAFDWTHDFGDGAPLQVQGYYDRTHRDQPGILLESVNTFNIEFQHSFGIGESHHVIWGGGYRNTSDFIDLPAPFDVAHARAQLDLGSMFVQDEIALSSTVKATAGLKVEHHTYTGFEYMPNVRLSWQPVSNQLVWASISRAVRTPARLDRELQALPILVPSPDFDSETLLAYEAGYRGRIFDRLTLSVSAFYNHYDNLRTTNLLIGGTGLVVQIRNGMKGDTYGVETWAQLGITDWWRLSGGVTALEKDLVFKPAVVDVSSGQAAGNDPGYQFSIRSLMTPIHGVDIDVGLRSVDNLIAPVTRSYVELDVRLGWRVADNVELSVAAFNLLHDQHPEGGPLAARHEIRRNIQGAVRWAF